MALSLLAGAALNVTVALSFALWGTAPQLSPDSVRDLSLKATRRTWHRYRLDDWPQEPMGPGFVESYKSCLILNAENHIALEIADATSQQPASVATDYLLAETRYGWPLRSMRCAVLFVSESGRVNVRARNGWHFPNGIPWLGTSNLEVIPFEPMPIGFIANTLLYAGASCLLFGGPFVIRRWSRIRHGRCPSCGYDLKGTTHPRCPECGSLAY